MCETVFGGSHSGGSAPSTGEATGGGAADEEEAMSQEGGAELIRLEGVNKVFFTDEVETHALSDIHPLGRMVRPTPAAAAVLRNCRRATVLVCFRFSMGEVVMVGRSLCEG